MKIYIQNMVSLRCKMVVKAELEKLSIAHTSLELGEVNLVRIISEKKKEMLKVALHSSGLELIEDHRAVLVEKIKNIIIEMVHYSDDVLKINFSAFLSEKLNLDYHKLSEIFSKTKGITIEQFVILHKVERIKELIMYDELNLTEISFKMNYSSVGHLSNQFKKVTGLTPTFFKNLTDRTRKNLESL